ncbi:hypothetical protein [Clostridium sp.]|uniref:hypothetical protein n=1 Tax=Clostridium sp. TaxID=1506 RepID=UPI003F35B38E
MSKKFNCITDKFIDKTNEFLQVNKKLSLEYTIIVEYIFDNSYVDIDICKCTDDYKLDIILKTKEIVKICGIVKDLEGKIVEGQIVTLLKEIHRGYGVDRIQDGDAITDSSGMFTFIRKDITPGITYKVIIY